MSKQQIGRVDITAKVQKIVGCAGGFMTRAFELTDRMDCHVNAEGTCHGDIPTRTVAPCGGCRRRRSLAASGLDGNLSLATSAHPGWLCCERRMVPHRCPTIASGTSGTRGVKGHRDRGKTTVCGAAVPRRYVSPGVNGGPLCPRAPAAPRMRNGRP